jgi:hypothetical protein
MCLESFKYVLFFSSYCLTQPLQGFETYVSNPFSMFFLFYFLTQSLQGLETHVFSPLVFFL